MADDELSRLLDRVGDGEDGDALDELAALLSADGRPDATTLERLQGVLQSVREATDPGIRSAPRTVHPAAPRAGWGLAVGVAMAAAAALFISVANGPGGEDVLVRGAPADVSWSDAAQAALKACCRAREPVRARLFVGPDGRVERVELLGSRVDDAVALHATASLAPAPSHLRGSSVDIWLE